MHTRQPTTLIPALITTNKNNIKPTLTPNDLLTIAFEELSFCVKVLVVEMYSVTCKMFYVTRKH